MSITVKLGYPQIGKHRELMFALENYRSKKWNTDSQAKRKQYRR